jgi:hypothetical protein
MIRNQVALCGATSQTHEICNLPEGHVERGIRMHSAFLADGSYSHRWYCEDEVSVPSVIFA